MSVYPLCNETIVRSLLVAMEPEPSKNSDGTQRMDTFTNYPQWNIHLVTRGSRGPETITVSVASPTAPGFVPGQVPVFANLVVRSGLSQKNGKPYEIVNAEAVQFVDTDKFPATLAKQREISARAVNGAVPETAAA